MSKDNPALSSSAGLFKGTMLYCGAHYTLCPVEIREIWAQGYALPEGPAALRQIIVEKMQDTDAEMAVISTCNRFDICLFGRLNKNLISEIFAAFALWTLPRVPALQSNAEKHKSRLRDVGSWLRIFADEQAVHHLFRVSASLDSLVLGEPHILGQLKDSFQTAVAAGLAHQEATLAFNRAFQVAKKVRTETDLGKNGISIGHAAVDVVRRVFEQLSQHSCLILGAGEMAKITAQHLRTCGAGSITIANRTLANAQKLSDQLPDARAVTLEHGLTNVGDYDVIIAATSSQDFILRREIHTDRLSRRKVGTPCVLVDISVPRNIDPALGDLKNIFVFDVDDLDKVMESSRKAREKAAQDAETIIDAELTEFISHHRQRENLVHIGQFHVLVKTIVEREIQKSLRIDPALGDEQVRITAEAVAKKLVAHPALLARTDARIDSEQDSIGDVLRYLFNLQQSE